LFYLFYFLFVQVLATSHWVVKIEYAHSKWLCWDRCYDFLNIFAEKFTKNWCFWLKTKLNYANFWS
jgi:hypothetical protein